MALQPATEDVDSSISAKARANWRRLTLVTRILRQLSQQSVISQPGNLYNHITISGNARVHLGNNVVHSEERSPGPQGKPFFVPFSRNPQFVGRHAVLERLQANIDPERHSRAAVTGMGGAG